MVIARLYTKYGFETEEKALVFFKFLDNYSGLFAIERYGLHEPLKKVYSKGGNQECVDMLRGYSVGASGDIILKGKKNKFCCWVKWSKGCVMEWLFWWDEKLFNQSKMVDDFLDFFISLSLQFEVIFGGVASEKEWDAKHLKVEECEDGGETVTRVGLEWKEWLPGLYWLTIFNQRELVQMSKELEALKNHAIREYEGIVVLKRGALPGHFNNMEVQDIERKLLEKLGENYFFDIQESNRQLIKVVK